MSNETRPGYNDGEGWFTLTASVPERNRFSNAVANPLLDLEADFLDLFKTTSDDDDHHAGQRFVRIIRDDTSGWQTFWKDQAIPLERLSDAYVAGFAVGAAEAARASASK